MTDPYEEVSPVILDGGAIQEVDNFRKRLFFFVFAYNCSIFFFSFVGGKGLSLLFLIPVSFGCYVISNIMGSLITNRTSEVRYRKKNDSAAVDQYQKSYEEAVHKYRKNIVAYFRIFGATYLIFIILGTCLWIFECGVFK